MTVLSKGFRLRLPEFKDVSESSGLRWARQPSKKWAEQSLKFSSMEFVLGGLAVV